jgi:hypothetical protein
MGGHLKLTSHFKTFKKYKVNKQKTPIKEDLKEIIGKEIISMNIIIV